MGSEFQEMTVQTQNRLTLEEFLAFLEGLELIPEQLFQQAGIP